MNLMKIALCRLLIVLMAWTPFQFAHAGIIGTDQALGSTQVERAAVLALASRSDIANQLQALGIDGATAKDRVAAMTDEEVRSLHGQLEAVPAGGDGWAIVAVILIGALIWYLFFRR